MAIPNWINHSLNITGSLSGTMKAVVLFVFLPLIFYLTFAIIKRAAAKESWLKAFTQIVIAILPVTAGMHLLKSLLKTTSRIPYWKFALAEPDGVDNAQMLINHPQLLNKEILAGIAPVISIAAILLPLGAFILSLLIIRKQQYANRLSKTISVIAVLIYACIFLMPLTAWRFF